MAEYKYFTSVVFGNTRPYYFGTDLELSKKDGVVVETIRGIEVGFVDKDVRPIEELSSSLELKPILRKATEDDLECYYKNIIDAKEAFAYCKDTIEYLKLDMKLLEAQYVLDKSKIIFIYASDNRVDFRDLLKDLASTLRCRIELRQIGSRDRSKLIGGLGPCGMPLCCNTFLGDFDGITINMAKNQFLALNIQKLSGQCGKLMCCLKFENDTYSEIRKDLPKINTRIEYADQQYKITSINILTNQVRLENSENILLVNLNEIQEILKENDARNNQ